jgi:hypothetical protein
VNHIRARDILAFNIIIGNPQKSLLTRNAILVLRFDKAVRPCIERKRWHPSHVNTPLPNGSLELALRMNGIEGVRH